MDLKTHCGQHWLQPKRLYGIIKRVIPHLTSIIRPGELPRGQLEVILAFRGEARHPQRISCENCNIKIYCTTIIMLVITDPQHWLTVGIIFLLTEMFKMLFLCRRKCFKFLHEVFGKSAGQGHAERRKGNPFGEY